MSETSNEPREEPDIGLIADEDLPEELQPSEDNPLAQQPEDQDDAGNEDPKVEGMPDINQPR